jgi:hypothetical protein
VTRLINAAQDEMAADPDGEQPGRFGFDLAEFRLHIAEANLLLGEHAQALAHAQASIDQVSIGRPAWAAARLVLARGETARGRLSDGAALGLGVIDAIPAPALRETSRVRLRLLAGELFAAGDPGTEASDLRDRLRSLPPIAQIERTSDEPNGV